MGRWRLGRTAPCPGVHRRSSLRLGLARLVSTSALVGPSGGRSALPATALASPPLPAFSPSKRRSGSALLARPQQPAPRGFRGAACPVVRTPVGTAQRP